MSLSKIKALWTLFMDWMNSPWTTFQSETSSNKKNPWIVLIATFFIILPIVNFAINMQQIFTVAEEIRDPKDRPVTEGELDIIQQEIQNLSASKKQSNEELNDKLNVLQSKLRDDYVAKHRHNENKEITNK